jgi:hypothetical protein
MSRESKILRPGEMGLEKVIHHYESFGWELLSITGDAIALSRDTQNPVYTTLVRNEIKYNKLVKEYNEMQPPVAPEAPEPFRLGACLLRLILLLIPGFVYIRRKRQEKLQWEASMARYNKALDRYEESKKEALDNIAKLLKESRATFFARQK